MFWSKSSVLVKNREKSSVLDFSLQNKIQEKPSGANFGWLCNTSFQANSRHATEGGKNDLHTRFGSQPRYGFCYFHVEYVITSRRALVTTVSILPAETLANYRRRTGSVDSKVSHRESANHNLSKGSSKLEERQPSGSLIQKFKDRFKEGECLLCGTGKFSPDHNCKATKFYQEEAKNFVKSSEFKQLKSNQKISFKDSPKSKMPSGDSRSKPLGELDRKGSKETS